MMGTMKFKAVTATGCCSKMAMCDKNACGAGYKLKANAETTLRCTYNKCMVGHDQSTCCELDTTLCLWASQQVATYSCGAGKQIDVSKIGMPRDGDNTKYM